MTGPLKHSLIYAAGAGCIYILLHFMPANIGFYGLLFFYLVNLPGLAVVNLGLLAWDGPRDSEQFKPGADVAMIAINAAVVFFLSCVRTRP